MIVRARGLAIQDRFFEFASQVLRTPQVAGCPCRPPRAPVPLGDLHPAQTLRAIVVVAWSARSGDILWVRAARSVTRKEVAALTSRAVS